MIEAGDENFSLVIMDLIMPNMDGFELLRSVRQSLSTQSLPVIVLTGSANPATSSKCWRPALTISCSSRSRPIGSRLGCGPCCVVRVCGSGRQETRRPVPSGACLGSS